MTKYDDFLQTRTNRDEETRLEELDNMTTHCYFEHARICIDPINMDCDNCVYSIEWIGGNIP